MKTVKGRLLNFAVILITCAAIVCSFATPAEAAEVNYTYGEIQPVTDFDYSILGIPDIQNLTKWLGGTLQTMFYTLSRTAERDKLEFALSVGDVVQDSTDEQFTTAREAFAYFDDAGIPYVVVPGNHDYDRYTGDVPTDKSSTRFNRFFNYDDYKDLPTFGGTMAEKDMTNTYHLFEVAGVKYLVIGLECAPSSSVLGWANNLIKEHSDRRTIIVTHDYMERDKSRSPAGEAIFNMAKKHNNVFLILCGHKSTLDPLMRMDFGDEGNKIMQILLCHQNTFDEGGNNVPLALSMKFNEREKTVNFCLYNPVNGKLFNNNQFTHNFADKYNPTVGEKEKPAPTPTPAPDGEKGCKTVYATVLPLIGALALAALAKARKSKSDYTYEI